jgi:predicted Zn-dependent protease
MDISWWTVFKISRHKYLFRVKKMSLEQQKELLHEVSELALSKVKSLGAEAFINSSVATQYATRFSNSEILQNYLDFRRNFQLTVVINDKQKSTSSTNDLSKDNILKFVEFVTKAAKMVPPDPMYPGILKEEQKYPNLKLNDPKARSLEPSNIIDRIEGAIIAGEAVDKNIAGVSGNFLLSDGYRLFSSTSGTETVYPGTSVTSNLNIQALKEGEESRSNSNFGSRFFDKLHMEKESIEVAERAIQGLGAISIEPGNYEVLLDHQAVATIMRMTARATSSMQLISRRSFLMDKIGQQVFDTNFTIANDPHNVELISARPIDDEGLATQSFPVIENGVLKNYAFSRLHAAKVGAQPKGCALSFMGRTIGIPFAMTMKPGTQSKEDLVSEIDDGLLVTNLHYTNFVNPPAGSITGMSKDGLFIIKNGEIVGSAKNMRFTDELPRFLADMDVAKELRQPSAMMGIGSLVAPIRVNSFKFTSKTEH